MSLIFRTAWRRLKLGFKIFIRKCQAWCRLNGYFGRLRLKLHATSSAWAQKVGLIQPLMWLESNPDPLACRADISPMVAQASVGKIYCVSNRLGLYDRMISAAVSPSPGESKETNPLKASDDGRDILVNTFWLISSQGEQYAFGNSLEHGQWWWRKWKSDGILSEQAGFESRDTLGFFCSEWLFIYSQWALGFL